MRDTVVVAIPTLNEARNIEAVLRDLSGDLRPGRVVFAVADGGSTDGTQEIVRSIAKTRKDIVLIHNEARLQSAGINKIAEAFRNEAEILVRCDAHAGYPQGFVRNLVESMHNSGADSVVVPMDSTGETCLQKAIAWVSDTPIGSGGSAHRGGKRSGFVDHGHHAAIAMKAFRRLGGYEHSFSHNEDAEFDCRLRALGGKIFLDSDIRIQYRPRRTLAGLFKQYFNYGKGRSRTVRRHPQSLRLRQFAVPAFLAACLLAIALSPLEPALLALPIFYVAALSVASLSIAFKKRSICGLLAGPAAFTMHTSWAAGFVAGMLTVRESQWQADVTQPIGEAR